MEKDEEIEFTPLQDEMLTLLDINNIDENLCDTCLDAFSTDESIQSAINWLKGNPGFTNADVSGIIAEFGVDSEDFYVYRDGYEIVDDEDEE